MVTVVSGPKVRQCTCRECGSTLEFTHSDIRSQSGRDISGCYDTDYYILCPVCTTKCFVSRR